MSVQGAVAAKQVAGVSLCFFRSYLCVWVVLCIVDCILLVVFFHWGLEDVTEPIRLQRNRGHALIDAGVDLIVGTHVHVLQPEEWYKGKLIFYGLGNFVFTGMNYDDRHRTGAYLEATAGPKGLVDRKYYRIQLDGVGAPRWMDNEPSEPPRVADSEPPNL